MRGLAIESDRLGEFLPTEEFPNRVVSVVVDKGFPLDQVVTAIRECPWPEVTWAYRDRDAVAQSAFEEAGVEALSIPLNPHWKGETYDLRRIVREFEMMYGSTNVLVFRNGASSVSKHWEGRVSPRASISVIEYKPKRGGKKK